MREPGNPFPPHPSSPSYNSSSPANSLQRTLSSLTLQIGVFPMMVGPQLHISQFPTFSFSVSLAGSAPELAFHYWSSSGLYPRCSYSLSQWFHSCNHYLYLEDSLINSPTQTFLQLSSVPKCLAGIYSWVSQGHLKLFPYFLVTEFPCCWKWQCTQLKRLQFPALAARDGQWSVCRSNEIELPGKVLYKRLTQLEVLPLLLLRLPPPSALKGDMIAGATVVILREWGKPEDENEH